MSTVDDMDPACSACGDTKPLGPDGTCEWRAGCEHRQMIQAVRMAELDRFLAGRPATPTYGIRRIEGGELDIEGVRGENDYELFREAFEAEVVFREFPAELVDMAREAMLRLSEDARTAGLIGPDEEFVFDLSDLLTYRRDDD